MSSKKTITLKEDVIRTIIDSMFTKNIKNRKAIMDMVINVFSSSELAILIEILNSSDTYVPFAQGGYVKITPQKGWKGYRYEEDILKDMGLLADDGSLYGKITNDDHWNDEGFNPFFEKFKIDVFLHEDDVHTVKIEDMTLKANALRPVSIKDIKHFNSKPKKNGTHIRKSVNKGISKLEEKSDLPV